MPSRRDLLTIAALVIADAAWLFPISGLIGLGLGLGRPLLPLAMMVILIVVAIGVVWTVAGTIGKSNKYGPYQATVGLVVIYFALAVTAADLLWVPHMFYGDHDGNRAGGAGGLVIGSFAAGLLWFRGVAIAVETHPPLRLQATFRTGIVALAIAIIVEQSFAVDAHATVMLVPFFIICLAGLAFTRLPPGRA